MNQSTSEKKGTCNGCGRCAAVCPVAMLVVEGKQVRERGGQELECFHCGQCVTVCPTGTMTRELAAVTVAEASEHGVTGDQLLAFCQSRRSTRGFKKRPVDRALLAQIIEIASTAPIGAGRHTTELTVVDDPEHIKAISLGVRGRYERMLSAMSNPIGRLIVRHKTGPTLFHTVKAHVVPIIKIAQRLKEGGVDKLTYDAPALILFHANKWEIVAEENAHIAATYALLAAHALGLGATWMSIITPAVNREPRLRSLVELPEENELFVSIVVGHPKVRHKRIVRREFKSVRFLSRNEGK